MEMCQFEFVMSRFFYSIEPKGKQASLFFILIVQILPIAILGYGFFMYEEEVEQQAFIDQVKKIDKKHLINVNKSLEKLRPSRAMLSKDKGEHLMFYESLANISGFVLTDFKSLSRMSEEGIVPTDCKLVLRGDLYRVPVLIELLETSRVLSLIEKIDIAVHNLMGAVVTIELRVFRPDIPTSAWLKGLSVDEVQQETLEKGWLLWNWRTYVKKENQLEKQSEERFNILKSEIPPKIIPLRKKRNRTVSWAFEEDTTVSETD